MTNISKRVRRSESLEEEIERLDEEFTGKRPQQTFLDYQTAVAQKTAPWPNENRNEAFKNIASLALQAQNESNLEKKMTYLAAILRLTAEICDTIPVTLERIAQISLQQEQVENRTQYFTESKRKEYLPLDDAALRISKTDNLGE